MAASQNDSIRIGLIGAAGRMGLALTRLIHQAEDLSLASAVVSADNPMQGRDIGELAGIGPLGVQLETELQVCDVAIDFSSPDALPGHLEHCRASGIALVSGTTGIDEVVHTQLDQAANDIAVLWAANMSIGVQLSYQLAALAARSLGEAADIEVVEYHHRYKKDAPSGTALKFVDEIKQALEDGQQRSVVSGRHGVDSQREPGEIGVSAIRGGDIIGEHTVVFAMDGERIEVTHKASSRDAFAQGALQAARWLSAQPNGRYQLSDLFSGDQG